MKSRSIRRVGILAVAMSTISGLVSPAFAAASLQGFSCDQRATVSIQNGTAHDKKFWIPGINKVAVLVNADASDPAGITYEFNPPIPFRFIDWYYKQAAGSNALRDVNVRYCFALADGSQQTSFNIQGGQSDRGGSVGDGWSRVVQDTRVFPGIVLGGNAYISKLTFVFNNPNKSNNITLGRVEINQASISPTLITATGDCSLQDACDAK